MRNFKVKKIFIGSLLSIFSISSAYAIYMNVGNKAVGIQPGKSFQSENIQPPPAMVSILDGLNTPKNAQSYPLVNFFGYYFEHDCAGTVIANNPLAKTYYILTAAHCVSSSPKVDPKNKIKVDSLADKILVFGETWCQKKNANGSCSLLSNFVVGALGSIKAFYIPSLWVNTILSGGSSMDGDMAIIQVQGTLPKNVTPMSVAYNAPGYNPLSEAPLNLKVAGWGTTMPGQFLNWHSKGIKFNSPTTPNYANVTSVKDETCQTQLINAENQMFNEHNKTTPAAYSNMETLLCAGLPNQSTACYGDSGGPLYQDYLDNGVTQYILYGNVSSSPALCQPTTCDNPNSLTDCAVNYNHKQILKPAPQKNPVPHVYNFPGALLCNSKNLSSIKWYRFVSYNQNTDPVYTKSSLPEPEVLLKSGWGISQFINCVPAGPRSSI